MHARPELGQHIQVGCDWANKDFSQATGYLKNLKAYLGLVTEVDHATGLVTAIVWLASHGWTQFDKMKYSYELANNAWRYPPDQGEWLDSDDNSAPGLEDEPSEVTQYPICLREARSPEKRWL